MPNPLLHLLEILWIALSCENRSSVHLLWSIGTIEDISWCGNELWHIIVMACKTLRFFLPELAIWNYRGTLCSKISNPFRSDHKLSHHDCSFLPQGIVSLLVPSKASQQVHIGSKALFYMVKLAREFQIKGANDLAVTNLGYYRYRAYPVTVWIGM